MVLGEEGRRKMENRTRPNDHVFGEYYELITSTHTAKTFYEAKRVLKNFTSL